MLGERYANFVINQLVNGGIIEVLKGKNGKAVYSAGNFSKAYRLTKQYTTNIKLKKYQRILIVGK
jgi:hypothetical protein